MNNSLRFRLFKTNNFPYIREMISSYEEEKQKNERTEMFMYFKADEAQTLINKIREKTGNILITRGTYAFRRIGGGLYEVQFSDLSESKLWRILGNFAPVLCSYEIYTYKIVGCRPSYIGGQETCRKYSLVKKWVKEEDNEN